MRVSVGVYVHAEPERLQATLAALRANTNGSFELLLLPDGADERTAAALGRMVDIPQSSSLEPLGTPACFNRLVRWSQADRIVLIESGCLPGPGWLDYLMEALDADPRNGLAGPSTNLCWNEQGAFRRAGASMQGIVTLEPLHSLADFCYAVRRDVIDSIGLADEGYGLGPCWEMDYNIRAARAGFRGVWARSAYVHRSPFTHRRQREEARRFEASRHRYQDKFCGLRLRGQGTAYEPHCRGEECDHFAPPDLIRIREAQPAAPELRPVHRSAPVYPLVTCIMPTRNRRSFVPKAIEYFRRQDYPRMELLIVDDGTDPVSDCVPADSRIRYLRLHEGLTIGAKRNVACEEARGKIIVHWDDDDWYPSNRVRTQVGALIERSADVCGSSQLYFYEAAQDRAWMYRFAGRPTPWLAGNTLAYRKTFWQGNRFPDLQIGEDARFLWTNTPKVVWDLDEPAICIGLIHSGNASPKDKQGAWWHAEPASRIHTLLGSDLPFYRAASAPSAPLISCIMPTCDRRPFVPLALERFRTQDYPNKELIIVDDGGDPVGAMVEGQAGIRYIRLDAHASIGRKRNLACEQARGEIIAHWDDDDWYGPGRLRHQADPILRGEADLTGLTNAFVLDTSETTFWTLSAGLHQRMFIGDVHGGTLAYRKDLFDAGLRYPEVDLAEDATLIRKATLRGKRLLKLDNPGVFVYVRHRRNAWRFKTGEYLDSSGWSRVEAPAAFSTDVLEAYCAAAAEISG